MDDFEVLAASERNTTEVDPSSWIIEDVGKTETIATEGNGPVAIEFSVENLVPLHALEIRRQEEIAAKDVEERRQLDELRQQAKKDVEQWYTERQRQVEQRKRAAQQEEEALRGKALKKSSKGSCDWSEVIKLLDLSSSQSVNKSKQDMSRMKSAIINAKLFNEAKPATNGVPTAKGNK